MRCATANDAPSSAPMPSGLRRTNSAGATTCEAKLPAAMASTGSPIVKPVTPAPIALIRPAHSAPSGPASPGYRPSTLSTSLKFRPVASTVIASSPVPGARCTIGRRTKRSSEPGCAGARRQTAGLSSGVAEGRCVRTSRATLRKLPRKARSGSALASSSSAMNVSTVVPVSMSTQVAPSSGCSRRSARARPQSVAARGAVTSSAGAAACAPRVSSHRRVGVPSETRPCASCKAARAGVVASMPSA